MSEVTSGTRAAGIWYRVISAADDHALSPAAARVLLRWKFPESDRQRVDQLSGKASAGKLSLTEQCELDEYLAHRRGLPGARVYREIPRSYFWILKPPRPTSVLAGGSVQGK